MKCNQIINKYDYQLNIVFRFLKFERKMVKDQRMGYQTADRESAYFGYFFLVKGTLSLF